MNQVNPSGHWRSNIHFGLTKVIAKALGFSKQDAYLIAKGCIGADKWTKKSGKWKLIIKNIPVSDRKKKEKITIKESDLPEFLDMQKSGGKGKKYLLEMKSIILHCSLMEINSAKQEQKDVHKAINNYFKNH